jgi:hypothetical protein
VYKKHQETYKFQPSLHCQPEYYKDYEEAYFGLTMKKEAGFECERHYEILARGSIPYFLDWDLYPSNVSVRLPKALITQAMSLPGVPNQSEVRNKIHLLPVNTSKNTSLLKKKERTKEEHI